MVYRVQIGDRAADEIRSLPRDVQKRVAHWLDLLAENPFGEGTKKLKATGRALYRVHGAKTM